MKGVWLEDRRLRLRDDLPVPEPPHGEALVRVLAAGICNTDLELVRGYYPYTGVLGHEFAGEVVSDGALAGKRVVGEINAACGTCEACRAGMGRHCPNRTVLGILRRLFAKLRVAFPYARLRVRLDGGFASPAVFRFLEQEGVEYLVVIASNPKLAKRVRRLLGKARMRSKATGETATLFGETRYAAKSWGRKRRIILKAEVVRLAGRDPRDNPRFVVTNLPQSPRRVYEIYRERGDVENRLKELHYGLGFDRTSCSDFWANAFRVLLTAAAYVLLQTLRARLAATPAADYQVTTLRERLFKLGARVQVSARRIVLHLPSAFPWLALWQAVALALGARPG